MAIKTLYLDVETTGVDPRRHGLVQLACIVEIDGEIKGQGCWNIRPFPEDEIEEKALEVTGLTREKLAGFKAPMAAFDEIDYFLGLYCDRYSRADKYYTVGYNVDFDMRFLAAFWKKCKNDYFGSFFNGKNIDPLPILRWMDWRGMISLPDYKLGTVCNHWGIDLAQAHDALADIKATRELIRLLGDCLKIEKKG